MIFRVLPERARPRFQASHSTIMAEEPGVRSHWKINGHKVALKPVLVGHVHVPTYLTNLLRYCPKTIVVVHYNHSIVSKSYICVLLADLSCNDNPSYMYE